MQRERPLERFLSRLLVVSILSTQLPLVTIARADDSDALDNPNIFESPAAVINSEGVPLPKPRPAAAGPSAADLAAAKNKKDWGVAQPIVDAHPEFDKNDKKQTSDTALCDVADAAKKTKNGIGAPIDSSPAKDTSKWDAAAKQYAADQRRLSLDNPSMNTQHNAFKGQIDGRVNLSGASDARNEFFQYAFGGQDKKPGWFVESICEGKRQIAGKIKTYEASLTNAKPDAGGCRAFETLRDMHGSILNVESKYLERVNAILNGTDKEIGGMKSFQGLEYFFDHDSAQDIALTKKAGDQAAANHVSADDAKQLDAENDALWGKIKHEKGTLKFEKQGYFSAVLLQLRTEQQRAKQTVASLTKAHDDAVKKLDSCKSENPYDYPAGKPALKPVGKPDITGLNTGKKPDVTGGSQAPGATAGGGPLNRHPPADPIVPADPADPVYTPTPAPNPAPAPATPPDPVPPPPPRQPSAAGTFLKDNWMWLAGGAALVGGGVYLYEQNKKTQEKKAYWGDDSNFLPPPPAPVTTTTGTTGTPAAGSKFTFVSSVTGPGGVGQSMGPISVTVTDANGVIQNVNGTAILSCAAPSPCSIGGATTATLTGGQATFTGVTFSNADQNVLLQVSGAGIANTSAPSTFNVGSTTSTNPRY